MSRSAQVTIWGSAAHANIGDQLLLDAAMATVRQSTQLRSVLVCARGSGAPAAGVVTYRMLPSLKVLRSAGFVVAGGTHVHYRGTFGRTAAPFRPLLMSVALGTPAVLLSIGLETDPRSDHMTGRIAEVCNLVTVRDDDSCARLRRRQLTVHRTRDLVDEVLASNTPTTIANAAPRYIAFAPSTDLMQRSFPSGERDQVFTAWVDRIREQAESYGATPLIICSSETDSDLAERLAPRIEVRRLHGLDLDAALQSLRNVEHIFTMRYHVGVLARWQGVRVTTIGDDPKLRSLRSSESDRSASDSDIGLLTNGELALALHAALSTRPTAQQRARAALMLARVAAALVIRAAAPDRLKARR